MTGSLFFCSAAQRELWSLMTPARLMERAAAICSQVAPSSRAWIGGPKSGLGIGEPGWHDSAICASCHGICTAELEEGQRP